MSANQIKLPVAVAHNSAFRGTIRDSDGATICFTGPGYEDEVVATLNAHPAALAEIARLRAALEEMHKAYLVARTLCQDEIGVSELGRACATAGVKAGFLQRSEEALDKNP